MLTEINITQLKSYCSGDITQIEGFWKAYNDTSDTRYCCHHREEISPDGTIISAKQLRREGRYFGLEPDKLIIMNLCEHNRLHNANRTEETRHKMSESQKGKPQPKYKWITPSGEIKEMSMCNAKCHHQDWILIE